MGQLQRVRPETVARVRKWLESREKRLSKSRHVIERNESGSYEWYDGYTFDDALDELLKEVGF